MSSFNDAIRFLQAVFPSYGTEAVFANLNPPAHTRRLTELDEARDCYWSIAAFPSEAKTNQGNDALHTVALVIDDVGTKVPVGAVELALGRPTGITRSSPGNYQWAYRLAKLVAIKDWDGFFAGVEALIGHTLEARSAQSLMRLPMGLNTFSSPSKAELKKTLGTFAVELVELNPEIELDPDTIPWVATKPLPIIEAGDTRKRQDILEVVKLVPNPDLHYDDWADMGARIKALAPDDETGRAAFHVLSAKSSKYDAEETDRRWDKLRADRTHGGLLLAAAEAAQPERFAQLDAKEVFNDGEDFSQIPLVASPKLAPHMLLSGEFVEGFVSPDYLVKKLITKSFLYSLTGQTGAGKTSITLRLAATIALGAAFGGLGSKSCRVLYLAAENPVDIQMRWIALAREMDFDVNTIPVVFIKGGFQISTAMPRLKAEALRVGGDFGLVVVDTGPVFLEGDDENDRVAMRKHARMFRELIDGIPGKPAVIVNVHPTKNATADTLIPAGGGSFLNEVDGNLTAAKSEDQSIELHWQGKWRGVEFAPLYFMLRTVTHPRLVDSDGDLMPTIVCDHQSSVARERMEQTKLDDQTKLLAEMARNTRASASDLAVHMGWLYDGGAPAKSKAQRYIDKLLKAKLVKKDHLGLWEVKSVPKAKANGSGEPTEPNRTEPHQNSRFEKGSSY